MTVSSILEEFADKLRVLSDTPELDAQVLLAHVTETTRSWILAHPESLLSDPQTDSARRALANLQAGMPLPYILGHWEFFGLDFDLTPDVLIPRPESELLVERAIAWLGKQPQPQFSSLRVADVGTGSGCIAVSLAKRIPTVQVTATDISLPALNVAKRNAVKHGVANHIDFIHCDLLPPRSNSHTSMAPLDLICANLPYIPTDTLQNLQVFKSEPSLALDGGTDGMNVIRRLLKIAPDWLNPRGMILLETEASLGLPTLSLAYDTFANAKIHLHQDLSGKDRLVEITLK